MASSIWTIQYYYEDPELRNARLDFRDVEPSHTLENVIFNELLLRGCQVDVGVVPIGDKRHEIDFVVNRAPGKLYIQVAYELPNEAKREQEMIPLRKCDDFFRKMIVVVGCTSDALHVRGHHRRRRNTILLDASILNKALAD